jgi:hypothetical protein
MVPTLVVSGPVGVGKTSVALEVSELLEAAGVAHAVVDLDALAWCFPRPADDRFNTGLALRNLAAVWANYQAAGAGCLVIARVIESHDDLAGFRAAIPGAEIVVVGLRAPIETLVERVNRRELGAAKTWHVRRAAELATQMDRHLVEDHLVETADRSIIEIAEEVLRCVGWQAASTR